MKEIEKMRSQMMYSFSDPEIIESQKHAQAACVRLLSMTVYDEGYREAIEDLIPGIPASSTVTPPIYCDHGHGIHLGEHVFVNYNATFLDGGDITIGDYVLIGPNCSFYTSQHPVDYISRRLPQETTYPIMIGEDTWIGGNVTVCPGVTIGKHCIIAAGSVVTHDIPDDCMAAGVPAEVKKHL